MAARACLGRLWIKKPAAIGAGAPPRNMKADAFYLKFDDDCSVGELAAKKKRRARGPPFPLKA
jgi:hypothetical protein